MNEQAKHFNSQKWGNLGPERVTACIKAYCDFSIENGIEGEQIRPKFPSESTRDKYYYLYQI